MKHIQMHESEMPRFVLAVDNSQYQHFFSKEEEENPSTRLRYESGYQEYNFDSFIGTRTDWLRILPESESWEKNQALNIFVVPRQKKEDGSYTYYAINTSRFVDGSFTTMIGVSDVVKLSDIRTTPGFQDTVDLDITIETAITRIVHEGFVLLAGPDANEAVIDPSSVLLTFTSEQGTMTEYGGTIVMVYYIEVPLLAMVGMKSRNLSIAYQMTVQDLMSDVDADYDRASACFLDYLNK